MPASFFSQATEAVVEWLEELREKDSVAYAKCLFTLERLREAGHELRRPTADLLRDGIHELRAKKGHVNYRLLYFFHGRAAVCIRGTARILYTDAACRRSAIQRRPAAA
jgi:hypothetical protein